MYFWRAFSISTLLHVSLIVIVLYGYMVSSPQPQLKQTPTTLRLEMFRIEEFSKPESTITKEETPKPLTQKNTTPKEPKRKTEREDKSFQKIVAKEEPITQTELPKIPMPTPTIESSLQVNESHEATVSIIEAITQAILHVKSYPKRAQRMGIEGEVILCFRWTPSGIENLHIQKSSGQKLLDEHSLEMIQQAQHAFPPTKEPIDITIPIGFKLAEIAKG